MLYVLIPLGLIVTAMLVWGWWQSRLGRDPVHSIDSFHQALSAMEPGSKGSAGRNMDIPDEDSGPRQHRDARDTDPRPRDDGNGDERDRTRRASSRAGSG